MYPSGSIGRVRTSFFWVDLCEMAPPQVLYAQVCSASGPRHCDLCVWPKGSIAEIPSTYECYVCMIRVWGLGSQNSGRYRQNRNLGAVQFMCAKTLITDIWCMLPGPAICVFWLLETLTNAIQGWMDPSGSIGRLRASFYWVDLCEMAPPQVLYAQVCLASGPRHCDLCVGQKGVLARKPSTYECYVCMIRVWGLGSQNSGRYGQNRNLGAAQFMCAKTLITDICCMLPGPAICVFCLLETLTNAI